MEVLPAPDGAVIIKILLLIGMCKENKEKGIIVEAFGLNFTEGIHSKKGCRKIEIQTTVQIQFLYKSFNIRTKRL